MDNSIIETDAQTLHAKLDLILAKVASPGRFLTVARAAEYTDLSQESIRRLLAAGKLTALRPVRGKILIDRRQLESMVLTSTTTPRTGRGRAMPK